MPVKKETLFILPYYFLIFVGLVLPSDGDHGILSIKSLAFLTTCGGVGLYAWFRQQFATHQLRLISFFLFSVVFLITWLFISTIRNQTTPSAQWDQFKLFLVTIIFPLLTIFIVNEHLIPPQKFLKIVVYSSFFYVIFKSLIVILYLFNFINIWELLNSMGLRFMSMKIYGGLDRVQTSADIVTPFLVFFVLQAHRLGVLFKPYFKSCYLILGLFSTFLSFSRYLVFIYILSCALYWVTLDFQKFVKSLLFILVGLSMAYLAIGPDKVNVIIERRVFSRETFKSDEVRVSQIRSLLTEYQQVPFIGQGLGGYSQSNIRDSLLLYNYEVQWMAFLMQFGMIGVLFIFVPFLIILCRLMSLALSRLRMAFCCLFVLWLFSGFMNPFLISLTSGIIYALFYLSADMLKTDEKYLAAKQSGILRKNARL
jgi:hypothetical protein